MSHFRWNNVTLPPNTVPDDHVHEILVYWTDGTFTFFGNSILWCLGHDPPHVALEQLVPTQEQVTRPGSHGIFLNVWTVERLLEDAVAADPRYEAFKTWFEAYLKNCTGNNPSNECPQGRD